MKKIDCLKKNECTGCYCCKNICPVNAITLVEDEEGFLYPKIDSKKCINCGLCYKSCPSINKINYNKINDSYIAVSKKDSIISTSGGIFPLLANYVLNLDGYVCGAIIDENNTIKHVVSNDINVINKMRGSKYTQSIIDNVYIEIRNLLNSNKYCLFTGTPCQVAGLKKFLKSENDKLICVDLICHGVSNQKFLKEDIKRKYNNALLVGFRQKNKFEGSTYKMKLIDNGKIINKYYYEDAYYNSFMKAYSFRESCYNCLYSISKRVGDITIGDSSCYLNNKQFKYDNSVSLVLINTKKGKDIFNNIKSNLKFDSTFLEQEILNNEQLHKPSNRPLERNNIFNDLKLLDYNSFEKKYTEKLSCVDIIKRDFKRLIPQKIKRAIKK